MANDGIITRKDVITDDAVNWGIEYSKAVDDAINANKTFTQSIKDMGKAFEYMNKAQSSTERAKALEAEKLANLQALNAVKQLQAADIATEKIKQEALKTMALEQKAIDQKTKASQVSVKQTIEERLQSQMQAKADKEAAMEKLGLIGAYQKLNKQRTEAKRKLMDLLAAEIQNEAEVKKATKAFNDLDKRVRSADASVGDFTKNVGNYPKLSSFKNTMMDIVGAFGLMAGAGAAVSMLKSAFNTIKEFDSAITELSAVTGVSKKELGSLKNVIIETSKASVNSAKEVADLAVELSKLGASVDEIEIMISTVDKFSVAMEASGAESAQFLLGVMNAFKASKDEAQRYGDVMAQAANISALGFRELNDSLKSVAPIASAAGYSIEQTAAKIGVLVDNNIEASTAGTSLRSILATIAKEGYTYEGSMKKILNSTDRVATATKLFGKESSTAAIILATSTEKINDYEKSLLNAKGALDDLNSVKMESLENSVKALSSAWDAFVLSIDNGDGVFSKFIQNSVKGLTALVNMLSLANKGLKQIGDETYNNSLKGTNQVIKEAQSYDILQKKIREEMNKTGVTMDVARKKIYAYYNANRQELESLVELEKANFNSSQQYESAVKSITSRMNEFTVKLEAQKKKVVEIQNEIEKGNVVSNTFLKRYDTLDAEQKKLDTLRVTYKNLQGQLDAYKNYSNTTEGLADGTITPESSKKAKKAQDDYLKRLKKFADDEYNLNLWRLQRAKELAMEIVENDEETSERRIDALMEAYQYEESIIKLTLENNLKNLTWYTKDARKLTQEEIDKLVEGGEIKTKLSKAEILLLEQTQAKRDDINRKQEKAIQDLQDKEIARMQKIIDKQNQADNAEVEDLIKKEMLMYNTMLQSNLVTEKAEEEHQARLQKIRDDASKKRLNKEIDNIESLLKIEGISNDSRVTLVESLNTKKRELAEVGIEINKQSNDKQLEQEKAYEEIKKQMYAEIATSISDIGNSFFESRINNIDAEISKLQEYYAKQIELAGDDQKQKDLLQKEADKKQKQLEEKKRKEQIKQAIFNKAMKVNEIGMATALAIMQAYAQLGVFAAPAALAIGITGAVQTAAVLATPIPKYKDGRKGGKEEIAILGDGGRQEVIERKKGGYEITPAYDTLYHLGDGDIVHKSVDEFARAKNLDAQMVKNQSRMNSYQESVSLNFKSDELLKEMKRNTRAIEKQKQPILKQSKQIDLNHEMWRMSQTKWS